MTIEQESTIDFVVHSPDPDEVLLIMVHEQGWGDSGLFLPALQAKFNTYLGYVLDGGLFVDYPEIKGKPIHIQLRTTEQPGEREMEFLRIVSEHHLRPENIRFSWRLTGHSEERFV